MWETAFEESMLSTCRNLIIHCPNEKLVESLMEIFERNGIEWCGGDLPTMYTNWGENESDTCYWVESNELSYSEKQYVDNNLDGEYAGHVRCTFYGVEEAPDFDVASDDEFCSLFGI